MHKKETHHHKGIEIFGKKTELYFAVLCGLFLVIGFLIATFTALPFWFSLSCYLISYFFGGYFISIEAFQKIIKGGFDIDFLAQVK